MADDPGSQTDTFRVKIPGGGEVSATGKETVVLLLVCLCFSGMAYLIWSHDANDREFQTKFVRAQQEMIEQQRAHTYVLTLPQDKREQLHLDMPDALRTRGRHRDD